MDQRPIFVATHPRACSTAFERVFMTQRNKLACFHEPFGDAFYYGPERMGERYEDDERTRCESGFAEVTYQATLDQFEEESAKGKRLLIKDMAYYLFPQPGKIEPISPSICHGVHHKRGVGTGDNGNGVFFDAHCPDLVVSEPENPTVIPRAMFGRFHFAFLIRHPRRSIPSYYRCTIPPLKHQTGWDTFLPSETGYEELRRLFDYLKSIKQIGPEIAGLHFGPGNGFSGKQQNGTASEQSMHNEICVIDADDLLDDPEGILEQFCASVGLEYDPSMLVWDSKEDHKQAEEAFEKWKGWHNDVLESDSLRPRLHKKAQKSEAEEYEEWVKRYGVHGAKVIQESVQANIEHYEYLKQYALKLRN